MLLKNYEPKTLPLGDPLDPKTLIGPMHTRGAVEGFQRRLESIKSNGGVVLNEQGHGVRDGVEGWEESRGGNWVWPTVVRPKEDDPCWKEESVPNSTGSTVYHPSLPLSVQSLSYVIQGHSGLQTAKELMLTLVIGPSHLSFTFPNFQLWNKQSH